MAGSIVVTQSRLDAGVTKYAVAWTSDASGDVNANTFAMASGTIVLVEFAPGASTPTNLYDVTMTDDLGVNVLGDGAGGSVGTDCLAAAATAKVPFIIGATGLFVRRFLHGGLYTPVVAAAGATKTGLINMYVAAALL
jgi:hypothetical protein